MNSNFETSTTTINITTSDLATEKPTAEKPKNDPVSHPSHYTSHPSGIECIEIARHYDFCLGNVIKYIWRAGLKKDPSLSDAAKELEDLKKAQWYLSKEISSLEEKIEKRK